MLLSFFYAQMQGEGVKETRIKLWSCPSIPDSSESVFEHSTHVFVSSGCGAVEVSVYCLAN